MRGASYTIDAVVRIDPTFAETSTGRPSSVVLDEPLLADNALGRRLNDDLIAVTVSNAIGRPYGTFQLTLAPRTITGQLTWADLIRPYYLVAIALHRRGTPPDRSTTVAPEPVMLGLVDWTGISEDYSTAQPRRVVRVVGRSLSALLADHRWWYHHFLATNPPPDLRSFYQTRPRMALLSDEVALRSLGLFAVDLDLFKDVTQRHPVEALRAAYEFFVGSAAKAGFIKFQLANKAPLSRRLAFDADLARESWPDPGARLVSQVIPSSELPQSTGWEILRHFCFPPFVELFTDTFGTSTGDAQCSIIARKPPFAGHIAYPPEGPSVAFSTGTQPPGPGASLFDSAYGEWEFQRETVVIDGSDVISRPILRRGLDVGELVNTFEVRPQIGSPGGNSQGDTLLQQEIPPLVDEEPDSPSYIRRFGIRPTTIRPNCIPLFTADGSTRVAGGDVVRHCLAYALLARTWLHWGPEFWSGSYVLKGRTALRVGRRLLDLDRNREFYIVATAHQMDLGSEEPSFTTTVQVARGWDLNG